MANNFTVTPTWVYPLGGEVHNVFTTTIPGYKRDYFLLSRNVMRSFRLEFDGISDTDFEVVRKHWNAVSGTFAAFTWKSVPSYIDAGAGGGVSVSGRWFGPPNWVPKETYWQVSIVFQAEPSVTGFITEAEDGLLLESGEALLPESG